MKIIILAAGKGERLLPLTQNTPTPLLDIGNGRSLLDEQIERIEASGVIDEIVLVVGHLAEQVEAKISCYRNNRTKIKTIYNPFIDISSNLISLWFARQEMDDSFLVTNGDNLFSADVFSDLVKKNSGGIFLAVCRKDKYDEDDIKVHLNENHVGRIGRMIPSMEANAEAPGLVLVSREESVNIFRRELESAARHPDNMQAVWPELLNIIIENGVPVFAREFGGSARWKEMDIHMDSRRIQKMMGFH